jgi:uncharacterized protein
VGYAADELVAWGEPAEVLAKTVAAVGEGCEVLTCIAGEGAPLGEAAVAEVVPNRLELDFHQGDQPAWWYLLCAE